MLEYYFGTYTDQLGTSPLTIENNFKYLRFKIRNIIFHDTDFDHLTVSDNRELTHVELEKFTWKNQALINYAIKIQLPLNLICIQSQQIIQCISDFSFELSETTYLAQLSFELFTQTYTASSSELESLFDQIQRQFLGQYRFQNCYGCLYADYSVYGQSFMGSMACFKPQQQKYLAVKNKNDYMQLNEVEYNIQEIYCCADYEIRDLNVGYRGCIK